MGSSFFKNAIDPVGKLVGQNSTLAKLAHYDPLMGDNGAGLGKYVNPNLYQAGVNYGNRRTDMNPAQTAARYPTPYAGQDPTLQAANAGYVTAANNAVNQKNQQWQQGSAYGQ